MESPTAFPVACSSQAELAVVGFCYFREAEAPGSRWSPAKRRGLSVSALKKSV